MAHPLLIALKPLALKLIMAKVSEKAGKKIELDKPAIKKTGTIYLVLVTALLTYLSSKGYIDPALFELLNSILTSPEVAAEADKAIEKL